MEYCAGRARTDTEQTLLWSLRQLEVLDKAAYERVIQLMDELISQRGETSKERPPSSGSMSFLLE